MNRKQKDLHLLSLPVFALMSVCFWVLGGGSGAGAVLTEDSESINTALPVAADRELSGGRLDAMRDADERESKLRRRLRMQDNSFDWLDAVGQRGEDSTVRAAVSGLPLRDLNNDVPEVNDRPRKPAAADRQRKEKGRDKRKEEMMRKKREQIEQSLGLDLATYAHGELEESADTADNAAGTPAPEPSAPRRGFYGLGNREQYDDGHIKAVVHGLHKDVTNGSIIKLRLLESVKAGEVEIPRNTFVYGKLGFSSGRAMVRIENINFRDRIVPFSGSLYDRDGFEGLYVPDNIISETKKNAASQAVSSTDLKLNSPMAMVNSAANAVTGAVKSALGTSVREVKITISSNYLITIKRNDDK